MTDPDLSEFFSESKAPHDRRCSISKIRDEVGEAERDRLDAAFNHEGISGAAIQRVLQSWGYDLSVGTVRNHRRGGCACRRN